jgi:D-alanyl-D-alanine dipeptidase
MLHTIRRLARALPLLAIAACATAQPSPSGLLGESRQILLVTTRGWDSSAAMLRRYERAGESDGWRPVGTPMRAIVGRSGLGVGGDLLGGAGPAKKEGDGRAPAGIFSVGPAFGYAPSGAIPSMRMPYLHLIPSVECVDDIASPRYNTIADTTKVTKDWRSSEAMWRAGRFYEWGLLVGHNTSPIVPGNGSCIFIHVWGGPSVTTSGCTALDSADVVELLGWLDPSKAPLLVQMPEDDLARLGLRELLGG